VNGEERFREWFTEYYRDILITPESAHRRYEIVAGGYEIAPRLAEAWSSFRSPAANLRPQLSKLVMPVFVAWAMKDGLVQWDRNHDALRSIPNGRVVQFQAGHAPFLETPDAFNEAIRPFLATQSKER
jgi:pimeloyl-ACP methyl ester carboxylesterase